MKPVSVVVLVILATAACATTTQDNDELSIAQAHKTALDLIGSAVDTNRCAISLISVVDALGGVPSSDTARYTAFVALNGDRCVDALNELRGRGASSSLSFVEMQAVEVPTDDTERSLDLINEVNPDAGARQ